MSRFISACTLYQKLSSPRSIEDFPGVSVVEIGRGLNSQEFAEFVGSLVIPDHVDWSGDFAPERPARLLGEVREMSRHSTDPRYPTRDQYFHTDLGYWGKKNQFATVLYAPHLEGPVAGTEYIDTSLLLQTAESDFPGITEILAEGTTVFSGAKYYTSVLPFKGSPDLIENTILKTLKDKKCKDLKALVAQEKRNFPPKCFPTIPRHPFRGSRCIVIDAPHTVNIKGSKLPRREVQHFISQFVLKYLDLKPEELAGRPYYAAHTWKEGQAVIWPQIGTLHRAQASPEGEILRDMLRGLIY